MPQMDLQKGRKSLTGFDAFIARLTKRYLTREPVLRSVRHSELSILTSVDDDAQPNELLLDLSLRVIQAALKTSLGDLAAKNLGLPDAVYYEVYPGEHYRLLEVLARTVARRKYS